MSQRTAVSNSAPSKPSDSAKAGVEPTALDKAFEALATYDYGAGRAALVPIDDAVVAALRDGAAARKLERRLANVLKSGASSVAKDYVCRKLGLIGSADSVPALAGLLGDKATSHAARAALEHIPDAKAVEVLRVCLPKLEGVQKIGVIISLGTRRDSESVPALVALLKDTDTRIAAAAASALGDIGTAEAARALRRFHRNAPDPIRPAVADACLACAERLSNEGRKAEALAIYRALDGSRQPKHIQLASTRGLAMVRGQK